MSERLKLFQDALNGCQQLAQNYPGNTTLESIEKQLEYLIGLEVGVVNDRARLRDIIIGVQAAREVEVLDENVAALLYKAASESARM